MTYKEARAAALAALKRGRGCDAGAQPCPFCKWSPDELTPQHDETGCEWLLDAALSAFSAHGWELVPKKAGITMVEDVLAFDNMNPSVQETLDVIIAAALKEHT